MNWEQEHLKEGRYTLNMVQIDHKIRQVINTIKMAEAEEAHQLNKIEDCIPQVSVASHIKATSLKYAHSLRNLLHSI